MKRLILTLLLATPVFAADAPFSSLTALTSLAGGDLFAVTDISDTTQSVNGTSKKITADNVAFFFLSDTAYSSAFNGVTAIAPSKNALYDYLHLGDADDDGKIDVLDLAAAGFPALDSAGALVASRSIAEGAAIDVTNGTGAAGNPTVAFDSTEVEAVTWFGGANASNIWSFNLSGTDTAITFSSGVINVSTGTLQQGGVDVVSTSGTQTFTNKTFDALATGNVVKFRSFPQFTSPLRVDGTNCTIGTTATAIGYGLGTFTGSDSIDQATNWMEFRIMVPSDWDVSVEPLIRIVDMTGADTSTRQYVASMASVAVSGAATGTLINPIVINMSADAGAVAGDVQVSSSTALTNWGSSCTPGNLLVIRIARDSNTATFDTSTVASTVLAVELAYGSTQ